MDLAKLKAGLKKDFISSSSSEDLQKLKVKYLGKKGKITNLSKQLGKLDIKQRPKALGLCFISNLPSCLDKLVIFPFFPRYLTFNF